MSDEPPDYLTTEDLLEIAAGVLGDVAVRDDGLLASAAGRPRTVQAVARGELEATEIARIQQPLEAWPS